MAPLKEIPTYSDAHIHLAFLRLEDEVKYSATSQVRVSVDDLRTLLHSFQAMGAELSQLIEDKYSNTRDISYEVKQREAIGKSLRVSL